MGMAHAMEIIEKVPLVLQKKKYSMIITKTLLRMTLFNFITVRPLQWTSVMEEGSWVNFKCIMGTWKPIAKVHSGREEMKKHYRYW